MASTGRASEKFRQFLTSSGKPVVAGKNAEQNEKVVKQAEKGEIVLHTKAAGSPFVNIKAAGAGVSKSDIREAAVFCARHSRDWKNNKCDVKVHVFKGSSIYKDKEMKTGTFGVKKFKEITIKKEEIKMFEERLK